MVQYHLIKFGVFKSHNDREANELFKIAESDFGARVYPIPENFIDEVEEKTLSAAYHGDRLVLVQFPSEEKHKEFVVFSGDYLLEHKTISNFGFPPISNNDFVGKVVVEWVKREIHDCLDPSVRCTSDPCIKASELGRVLETIRELDSESLEKIFRYANKLNLPPDFKKELKFEYERR